MSILDTVMGALAAVGATAVARTGWRHRAALLDRLDRPFQITRDVLRRIQSRRQDIAMRRRLADHAMVHRTNELELALRRYGLHLPECQLSIGGVRAPYQEKQDECTCSLWLTLNPPPQWEEAGTRTGFAFVDPASRIQFVSDWFCNLSGYRQELLIGQNVRRLVPERFREQHGAWEQRYFAAPVTRAMSSPRARVALLSADGREVPVDLGLNPVQAADGATWVLVTVRLRRERWW